MTPDPTTAVRTADAPAVATRGVLTDATAPDPTTTTLADTPRTAAPARGGFASATVPRHLARGALGLGALAGSLMLLPLTGPVSLLLAPIGLLALRGCPMCWAIGLAQTVSAGRLRRSCTDGRCELRVSVGAVSPRRPGTLAGAVSPAPSVARGQAVVPGKGPSRSSQTTLRHMKNEARKDNPGPSTPRPPAREREPVSPDENPPVPPNPPRPA